MTIKSLPLLAQAQQRAEMLQKFVPWKQGRRILSVFFSLAPFASQINWVVKAFKIREYVVKLESFVEQHPELRPVAARFVSTSGIISEGFLALASSKVWKNWDSYIKEGASKKALLRLQSSGRIDLDALAAAMSHESHESGRASVFLVDRTGGKEQLLKDLSKAQNKSVENAKNEAGVQVSSAACGEECANNRRVADVLADGVLYEANVGYVGLNDAVKARIDTDAALIAAGEIEGSHWHFYPSALGAAWWLS